MYNSIPEKYLPDRIVDNVAYFPDGRYQFVLEGQNQITQSGTTLSVNFPIAPSSSVSGIRTLRNLVVVIDPQVGSDVSAYFFISSELVVRREGLDTITQTGILEAHYDVQSIEPGLTSLGYYKLIYPDELKLNSGDSVVLVLKARTYPESVSFQVRIPIRSSYFIKFN